SSRVQFLGTWPMISKTARETEWRGGCVIHASINNQALVLRLLIEFLRGRRSFRSARRTRRWSITTEGPFRNHLARSAHLGFRENLRQREKFQLPIGVQRIGANRRIGINRCEAPHLDVNFPDPVRKVGKFVKTLPVSNGREFLISEGQNDRCAWYWHTTTEDLP